MKRSDRIYKLIGQAVVVIGMHATMIGLLVFGFMKNTIY